MAQRGLLSALEMLRSGLADIRDTRFLGIVGSCAAGTPRLGFVQARFDYDEAHDAERRKPAFSTIPPPEGWASDIDVHVTDPESAALLRLVARIQDETGIHIHLFQGSSRGSSFDAVIGLISGWTDLDLQSLLRRAADSRHWGSASSRPQS
jgi:hypothetical protein